jgi:O-antigen ligase
LGGGLGLLILEETYSPIVWLALGAMAASFLIRWLRSGHFLPRTGAELALGVFLASAALSAWVAYDRSLAFLQFVRLIATAVAFYGVVDGGPALRRLVTVGVAVATATLGVYFVLRYDFSADAGKFGGLTAIGNWLNAHLPAVPGPGVHPNVAGGALILGIPLAVVLVVEAWKQRHWVRAGLSGLLALIALGGLTLTSSRGAWLGLTGALGLGFLAWIQRRWLAKPKAALAFWLVLVAAGLVCVGGITQAGMFDRLLGQIPDPTGSLHGRTELWRHGALLARDYPFTGIGLLNFPMVFSAYTLLIHVPYIAHTHNTFLQVLVEQGWPGFVAMLGLGLVGLRWTWSLLRSPEVSPLAWGGLAAITAVILHGVVDVSLYLERTLPLLGIVAGLLAGEGRKGVPAMPKLTPIPVIACLLVLAAGIIFWQPLLADAQANLGAVIQTRLELGTYDSSHFDTLSLDQVRRMVDLSQAEASFRAALPNLTAVQRLTEIALSRGQYAPALEGIQVAWRTGARDEVTRLLYGDALAANGQPDAAAGAVQGLNWATGRLKFQAWYRYQRLGEFRRAADAWQAVVLLDPADAQAVKGLQDTLNQVKP